MKVKFLVQASIIAAVYTALTVFLMPISYGVVQVRVSEALTVLPFFTSAAIPGLTIGCLISNLIGGYGMLDIVFGTLATLLASICSYLLRKHKKLVPLPPVIANAVIIGAMLKYVAFPDMNIFLIMASVGIGQCIACYGIGLPILYYFDKHKNLNIFKLD